MPVEIVERHFTTSLAERLRTLALQGDVAVHWLGQAGFVVSAGSQRVLIDPYLSDTLAEKYHGTATPHERLMAAPSDIEGLGRIDLVLVTHQHTDHMDPGTLTPLAAAHPALRFVAPRASRVEAMRRAGVSEDRLLLMDAGETLAVPPHLTIRAVRAAHETLRRDEDGHHLFLGYALTFGGVDGRSATLLHSGDTVPYPGQVEELAKVAPDLLLLPVNGRSPELAALGMAGNLTLDEAVHLTHGTGTPAVVAHHHGMFAFNTLPMAAMEAKTREPGLPVRLIPARAGLEIRLRPT